jgi:pimeloyl-ACP methyl ester carboxylesterase
LIVHGDKDPIVPLIQSKKLLKSLDGEKRLEILPGAGHVMSNKDIEKTSILIADFFAKNLL